MNISKSEKSAENTALGGSSTDSMNIVIVGHVDHGKSTIVGKLLAETGSLPEGKLEQVRESCEKSSKPFEYAFLLDALKDEQSQGITIDTARIFFKTGKRHYVIFDAPGHIEFLKNMITGASHAEAAVLVIDASEGIKENSKRHGYMLSMLGITQVAVIINKMDLVDYDESVYNDITNQYMLFLNEIGIEPSTFIPVSGINGDNITSEFNRMGWFKGSCLLDSLDNFNSEKKEESLPFRMPVQDIYKFTKFGDNRRIIAGTVLTGSITVGDEIIFYPSGKKSNIKSIESFNSPENKSVESPFATGFTLEDELYIPRGELIVKTGEKKPEVSSRIMVSLFWLGRKPMQPDKDYYIKIGKAKVSARLEKIIKVIDASSLDYEQKSDNINRHDVAECILSLLKPVAFDKVEDNQYTSRFVIVDDYEIAGGGIIRECLEDQQNWQRDKVSIRNYKWEMSSIPYEERAKKYNQNSSLVVISGKKDAGKKTFAKKIEKELVEKGRLSYFLGIGNIIYGVDADIKGISDMDIREEHIRRLAEVSNIMIEAGIILIITAIEINREDLKIINTSVNTDRILTIWVGEKNQVDLEYDIYIDSLNDIENSIGKVIKQINKL